jgi:hypothetical protein
MDNNHVDGTSQDVSNFVVAAVTAAAAAAAAADDDDVDNDDGLLSLATIVLISWIIKFRNIMYLIIYSYSIPQPTNSPPSLRIHLCSYKSLLSSRFI